MATTKLSDRIDRMVLMRTIAAERRSSPPSWPAIMYETVAVGQARNMRATLVSAGPRPSNRAVRRPTIGAIAILITEPTKA